MHLRDVNRGQLAVINCQNPVPHTNGNMSQFRESVRSAVLVLLRRCLDTPLFSNCLRSVVIFVHFVRAVRQVSGQQVEEVDSELVSITRIWTL